LHGTKCDGTDQTLSELVSQIWKEFMHGHFDSLLGLIEHVQALNPDMNFHPDDARYIQHIKSHTPRKVLMSLRELCLYSSRCLDVIKFDIINVYEIHNDLTSRSYFDFIGRAKLSCALSKGLLKIPLSLLQSNVTSDQEIMCGLLTHLICFLDSCETKITAPMSLMFGWKR